MHLDEVLEVGAGPFGLAGVLALQDRRLAALGDEDAFRFEVAADVGALFHHRLCEVGPFRIRVLAAWDHGLVLGWCGVAWDLVAPGAEVGDLGVLFVHGCCRCFGLCGFSTCVAAVGDLAWRRSELLSLWSRGRRVVDVFRGRSAVC